jgi:hypothetical protein
MYSFCRHIADRSHLAPRAGMDMRFSVSLTTKAKTTTKTV